MVGLGTLPAQTQGQDVGDPEEEEDVVDLDASVEDLDASGFEEGEDPEIDEDEEGEDAMDASME